MLTLLRTSNGLITLPLFLQQLYHLQHFGFLICQGEQSQIGVTFWYLQNIRAQSGSCFPRHLSQSHNNRVSIVAPLHLFLKSSVNLKKNLKNCWSSCMKGAGGGRCLKVCGDSKQRYGGIVKKTSVESCTYYANMLHLSCNHNRQGPSGSPDRCQPLIINVSSEKSHPGCSATLLARICQPDTGTNIYFLITVSQSPRYLHHTH